MADDVQKGFFRRSIQKKIKYRCLRDEKCLVIRLSRNRCQFCRFKKRLDVGMSRDSVQYGRVPKGTRERMEENRETQSEADQSAVRNSESKELAIYDLTLSILQAHSVNCQYTELKTRTLVRKPAIFSLSELGVPDSAEHQKILLWQKLAVGLNPSIHSVVEFFKKVPGFSHLHQKDRLIIIKKGFFEVWVLHTARLDPDGNSITFEDGSYVTRQQVELMFDYEFALALFNFINFFNSMELNDAEIGLFSAIILLSSEREGISDHKTIDQLQERLIEALKVHLAKHHQGEPNTFILLMIKLPELRSLGAKHWEHLDFFRANWDRLRVPQLFAEIFDISWFP